MGRVTKNKNFLCEECGNYFSTERRLRNHTSKFHPEKMDYICEECGRGFWNLKALLIHVTKVHDDRLYFDKYLNGNLKCEYIHCKKELNYENRYRGVYCCLQHCESQNRIDKGIELNYICPYCKSGFDDIGKFNWHLSKTHKFTKTQIKEYYDENFKKDGEGFCKWCGKDANFTGTFTNGYRSFCYNSDCNVNYHNKYENRHKVAGKSNSDTMKKQPEKYSNKIEYWLSQGYDEVTAKKKLSDRQRTFTKEKLILKYGKEEGLRRWVDRQERWQNTLKSKPKSEIMRINKLKAYSSGCISKTEKELCKILKAKSSLVIDSSIGYVYDIYKGNKIIEYNGDYWHCNPKEYPPTYYNKKIRMTASEKWMKDSEKIQYALNNGYDVKIVWEKDYNKDREKVIKECLEFISNN